MMPRMDISFISSAKNTFSLTSFITFSKWATGYRTQITSHPIISPPILTLAFSLYNIVACSTWVLISIFPAISINVWNITQTTFPSFMFMQFHDKRSYYRYSSLNSEANYIYYWEYLMLFNSVKMYSLILLLFFILN